MANEILRVGFPTNDEVTVEEHFGHCEKFVVYSVKEGEIVKKEVLDAPEHAPGVFPKFIAENNINVVITGGMGQRAIDLIKANGGQVILGAVEKSDYAIVVTELSPFGLSDMKLVVKLLRDLKVPFGVVINKDDSKENLVESYCQKEGIEILEKIPFDREIAKNYSEGNIIADILPEYRKSFEKILKRVQKYGD